MKNNKLRFFLNLTLELEDFLERSIDLIDINEEYIVNLIKIEALNSEMVIIEDNKYNEKFNNKNSSKFDF